MLSFFTRNLHIWASFFKWQFADIHLVFLLDYVLLFTYRYYMFVFSEEIFEKIQMKLLHHSSNWQYRIT